MSKPREAFVAEARAALVVAAMRRTLLTYEELGRAIGISGVGLSHQMRYILRDLSNECHEADQPSLPALVVNKRDGKPGQGWVDGDRHPWHTEVRRIYEYWRPV
ncbi:hypothetical protein [Cellulosimicrobium sp. SL-1]|uniref:hypothetical protein n=1 Tax=Cellulosimicrobium sp. SL-1 TaxID=2699423 RepID=UPI0013D83DAC|nr:hypothetical protein [Cellulosimicrobium sp. SL-1]